MNIHGFAQAKLEQKKISMVTCYDYTNARIANTSKVDVLLVGDSLGMVMYGHPSTLSVSADDIARHTQAVAKGAPDKFIVADMPFLSVRKGLPAAMDAVHQLMASGAHAVKVEGIDGHADIIQHIVESGVPVMGHLGLTPQSVHQLGGYKVQGKNDAQAQKITEQARQLEACGCFSMVLECVPSTLAQHITQILNIPTIGIGAGTHVDGQVLVMQDMLGMNSDFQPKFVRTYTNGIQDIKSALDQFAGDIETQNFPSPQESYE